MVDDVLHNFQLCFGSFWHVSATLSITKRISLFLYKMKKTETYLISSPYNNAQNICTLAIDSWLAAVAVVVIIEVWDPTKKKRNLLIGFTIMLLKAYISSKISCVLYSSVALCLASPSSYFFKLIMFSILSVVSLYQHKS